MATYGPDGEAAQSPADEGHRSILRRPTARGAVTPAAPTVAIDLHRIPNLLPQRRGTGKIAGPRGNKATKKFFRFYERQIVDELEPANRDARSTPSQNPTILRTSGPNFLFCGFQDS